MTAEEIIKIVEYLRDIENEEISDIRDDIETIQNQLEYIVRSIDDIKDRSEYDKMPFREMRLFE